MRPSQQLGKSALGQVLEFKGGPECVANGQPEQAPPCSVGIYLLSGFRHVPLAGIKDGARRPSFAEEGEPGIRPIENCAGATIYPGMTAPRRPAAKDPWLDKLNRLLARTVDLGPA
jgi:hypothetical protein